MTDKLSRHSFVLRAVSLYIAKKEASLRSTQTRLLTDAEGEEYLRLLKALGVQK